jgi:hypothetical protein
MRLVVASLSLLVLAACGPNPCPDSRASTTTVTPDVPSEYGALYNNFDAARLAALFPAHRQPDLALHQKNFASLQQQLGACGAPEFMWTRETPAGKATRWSYPCERGNLEASFALDPAGRILKMRTLAAGVPASDAMNAAARSLLAELPLAADAIRPYANNLSDPSVRALGRCEVVRPWAVSSRLALFHARCETGKDVVLGLRLRHGKITRAMIEPAETLYMGVAM